MKKNNYNFHIHNTITIKEHCNEKKTNEKSNSLKTFHVNSPCILKLRSTTTFFPLPLSLSLFTFFFSLSIFHFFVGESQLFEKKKQAEVIKKFCRVEHFSFSRPSLLSETLWLRPPSFFHGSNLRNGSMACVR